MKSIKSKKLLKKKSYCLNKSKIINRRGKIKIKIQRINQLEKILKIPQYKIQLKLTFNSVNF